MEKIKSLNHEISLMKSEITTLKEKLRKAAPIGDKIRWNDKIRLLKEKITDLEKQKTQLKRQMVENTNPQPVAAPKADVEAQSEKPKKEKAPKEDPTYDGHYFKDGQSRKRSEVFADADLKLEYQTVRKAERRAARAEKRKADKEANAPTEAKSTEAPKKE